VRASQDYWRKLTGGERESNTSILRTFDLSVIQRYFPEYEKTIGSMLE